MDLRDGIRFDHGLHVKGQTAPLQPFTDPYDESRLRHELAVMILCAAAGVVLLVVALSTMVETGDISRVVPETIAGGLLFSAFLLTLATDTRGRYLGTLRRRVGRRDIAPWAG